MLDVRIEEYTAQELFELLNELDETDSLEAKSLHKDSTRPIMESVCVFSNRDGGTVAVWYDLLSAA